MARHPDIRDTPDEIDLEPWAVGMHARDVEFVREFLADLNAYQAMRRIGYTEQHAKSNCSRQLRRPVIARAIAAAMAERAEALGITAKTVLGEAFRSYLAAAADRNWAAAARFLEMVGRHVDVRAFRDRVGLLDPDGSSMDFDLSVLSIDEKRVLLLSLERIGAARSGEADIEPPRLN